MKRLISIIVCMCLVISLFAAGCGSTKEQQVKPEESKAASDSNSGSNKADSQKFAGKKITAIYMSSVYADAAKSVTEEFKQMTGADVEIVDFPYVTLHEKIMLDLSSNTGAYDALSVACQWDGEFAPFLEELDPYIKRDNYDIDDIIENVLEQAGTWNGKTTGIPYANTPYTLAYRTDLVKEVPKTWDEYIEVVKSLTDESKGMYGVSIPGVKEQFAGLYYIRLWSMGGAWADENWVVAIDSPEARKALEHVKELFKYADPAAPSWGLEESINAFLQGKAAFCEAWPTLGITLNGDNPEKSKIVGNWDLAPFPADKTGLTLLSAWDISIPKASKNKDLAWEWIKFYTDKDKQYKFWKEYEICSPLKSFYEKPDVKSSKIASFRQALEKSIIWWRLPASTEADKGLGIAIGEYISGQTDIEETIKNMKKTIEDALKMSPPPAGVKNTNR